jgi:hypothetical protein
MSRGIGFVGILVVIAALAGPASAALVVDQQQGVYDEDMAISISAGIEQVGELFKAGTTGALMQIDVAFSGMISGEGILRVSRLDGGDLIELESVPVEINSEAPGLNYNSFALDVPIHADTYYLFLIEPVADTMPDPYYVCIARTEPLSDSSSLSFVENGDHWGPSDRDLVFRTWVEPVPEPGTVVLLGLGVLAAARRRRRGAERT